MASLDLPALISKLREDPSAVLAELHERNVPELVAVISHLLIDQGGIGSKLLAVLPAKWRAYAKIATWTISLLSAFGGGFSLSSLLPDRPAPAPAAVQQPAQKPAALDATKPIAPAKPLKFRVRVRDSGTGKILGEHETSAQIDFGGAGRLVILGRPAHERSDGRQQSRLVDRLEQMGEYRHGGDGRRCARAFDRDGPRLVA